MKDFTNEDVNEKIGQQMEQEEDIIEISKSTKTIGHQIGPEEMTALKRPLRRMTLRNG